MSQRQRNTPPEVFTAPIEVRDHREPGWFWADNRIIDDYAAKIGPHALAVYMLLCRYANQSGQAYPSLKTMAEKLGMCRRSIINAVDRLTKHRLIDKQTREDPERGHVSNIYFLLKLPPVCEIDYPSIPDALPLVHQMHQASAPDAPEEDLFTKTYFEEEKTPLTPQDGGITDTPISGRKKRKAEAQEVLSYLNEKAGRSLKRLALIPARLRDGHSVDDCKRVIDWLIEHKEPDWKTQYLDHTTPFRPGNFDKYLDQARRPEYTPTDMICGMPRETFVALPAREKYRLALASQKQGGAS